MIRDFHGNSHIVCTNLILNNCKISRDMYSLTVWGDKGPINHSLSSWVGEDGCIESSGPCIKNSELEAIGEVSIT